MRRYYLIAISFLVLAFGWDSLLIKPGRLLAVLVHEFCHGLAAMAGGVQLDLVQIHSNEAGETLVTGRLGFLSFLIAVSAGYLGTAVAGSTLLWSGLRHSYERTTLAVFILLLFYMSFVFTEPGSTAYLTGLLSSLFLVVLLFLGIEPAGKGLVVIGSFLIFYSLFDLFDFHSIQPNNDAKILIQYLQNQGYQNASNLVGTITFIWSAFIIAIVAFSLKSVFKAPFRQEAETIEIPTETETPPIATESPINDPTRNTANADQVLNQTQISTQIEQPSAAYNAKPPEGWSAQEMAEIQQLVAQLKE